jgi:uncharacterized protein YukE
MSMTVIAPPDDPTRLLQPPTSTSSGNFIWQLRIKAGLVVGGVDFFIDSITGFSPLEEWVAKPFGGDWTALDKGAVAWTNAGKAVSVVSSNIEALPGLIGDSWQGATAQSFAAAHAKIATAVKPLPEACDAMSEFCSELSEFAKSIAEFVLEVLQAIAEFAIEMIAALCVPVAGEISMPVWIAELGVKLGIWGPKIAEGIKLFGELVELLQPLIELIQKIMDMISVLLDALGKVQDAADQAVAASTSAQQAALA